MNASMRGILFEVVLCYVTARTEAEESETDEEDAFQCVVAASALALVGQHSTSLRTGE